MPRPCVCGKCRLCELYETRADYRAHWDKVSGVTTAPKKRKASWVSAPIERVKRKTCSHLGSDLGKLVECNTCKGKVQLKVFFCDVHGECTQGKKAQGLPCCENCKDRV